MSNKINYEGNVWEVLKDCGCFVVAKKIDSDEVRNISKQMISDINLTGKDQVEKSDRKPS